MSRGPITVLRREVARVADGFDPSGLSFVDVEAVVAEWAAIEKLACAAKLRAAARAEDIGLDAADAVAASSGITTGAARQQTRLRKKLAGKAATRAAFDRGHLSPTQADAIAETADVAPGAEQPLLDLVARGASAADLLNECARRRRDALDADGTLADKQHAARALRHWTDAMGMVCFTGKLAPVPGAKFVAELERRADRFFRKQVQAKAGVDTIEQRQADALNEIVASCDPAGTKRARGPRTQLHLIASKAAVERGYLEPGERCETADGKPIPLRAIDDALLDPDTKVQEVIFDVTDVQAIKRYTRYRPARLQDALIAQGLMCAVPGCGQTKGLQFDHKRPFGQGGPTSAENLKPLCRYHHDLKTRGLYDWIPDKHGTEQWTPIQARAPNA